VSLIYDLGRPLFSRAIGIGSKFRPVPNMDDGRLLEYCWCLSRMKTTGSVLDVGCGGGKFSHILSILGFQVTALDREMSPGVASSEVSFIKADILEYESPLKYNHIVAVSTIEHIGLSGRYGQSEKPDGDIRAMEKLRGLLATGGLVLLTIPVGKDRVIRPNNRVYGTTKLPLLLSHFNVVDELYLHKEDDRRWSPMSRKHALSIDASKDYSALGLFTLKGGE